MRSCDVGLFGQVIPF